MKKTERIPYEASRRLRNRNPNRQVKVKLRQGRTERRPSDALRG